MHLFWIQVYKTAMKSAKIVTSVFLPVCGVDDKEYTFLRYTSSNAMAYIDFVA